MCVGEAEIAKISKTGVGRFFAWPNATFFLEFLDAFKMPLRWKFCLSEHVGKYF